MKFAFLLAVLLAAIVCSPLMAETVSLANLINDDLSIVSGDKIFYDFEYITSGEDMPPAESVNVTDWVDSLGNYGIQIDGCFCDRYDSNSSDALIKYSVSVLDENKRISDVHLSGYPSVSGSGVLLVGETFLPDEPDKELAIYKINSGAAKTADVAYLDGLYETLRVQKDILAFATSEGSFASVTTLYQSFSQVEVPEPSTIVSVFTGLALLGCFAWRKRR